MRVEFKRKTRINNNSIIGGYSGGGSDIDVSNLQYVPCDRVSDADNWLIPDKPIKVLNGVSEFAGVKCDMLSVVDDAMLNWVECNDVYVHNEITCTGTVKASSGIFTGDIIARSTGAVIFTAE